MKRPDPFDDELELDEDVEEWPELDDEDEDELEDEDEEEDDDEFYSPLYDDEDAND